MSILLRALAFGLFAALATLVAKADDPIVDITLVANGDGDLEVRLRPDGPFDGIVSTVLFTIRWDAASDAHLGGVVQPAPHGSYIPISKSDAEIDADGYRYQIFSGVGFSPMQWIPTEWVAGEEYTVAIVHIASGASTFRIVNDDWTDANNGEYFVSLGGFDRTGVIYADQTVGVAAAATTGLTMDVQPNPAGSNAVLTIATDRARDLRLELITTTGTTLWTRRLPTIDGIRREPLDLGGVAAGVYLLRLSGEDHVLLHRLVKR